MLLTRKHFNRDLTTDEFLELFTKELLEKLEREQCDFTNSVSVDLDLNNQFEFSASIKIENFFGDQPFGDEFSHIIAIAYYYQDKDEVRATEDLGSLNWEIKHIRLI